MDNPLKSGRAMADHPFKGLYLTRLYHEGCEPFAVVTDLPRDEALAYCEKFAPWRRVGDGAGGQEAYLDGRIETENWLRMSAQSAGVDIQKQNPIYFTLTAEDQKDKAPEGMKAVSIPVNSAILKYCSFTIGDSMGNRTSNAPQEAAHRLQDVVLNAAQAATVIDADNIPGDYIKGGRYVEVQMWVRPSAEDTTPATAPASPAAKASIKSSFSAAP